MPSGPQPIFTDNPGSLPATYKIPAGISLDLSSVYAKIDGGGAGGSFLPCLTVLSQDGHVIARVKQDDTYAAGDTGDATWSPFLRGGGSGGGGASPLTTKGDIFGYDTADARIPVGSDGQILTADSGDALGVSWQPAPATSVLIDYVLFSAPAISITAGGREVPWTSIDDTLGQGGYITLNGSSRIQIESAGVYGIHLTTGGATLTNNVNTQTTLDVNVISGSQGRWSSKAAGSDEAFGVFAERIDDAASVSVLASGDETISAWVGWTSGNTFPVVIRVDCAVTEDNVGVTKNRSFQCGIIRFGAGDE